MKWSKILLHSLLKWKKNPFHFISYGHPNRIDKKKRNDFIHYMYLMITLMINKKSMNLRIMMNYDVIKNFIFQLKMKKLNIKEFYVSVSRFKTFDDIILRTYSSHILLIKIVDQANYVNFDRHDFITTNIMSIKLILKLF